jgi:ligand-binding sensor domain-containing protein
MKYAILLLLLCTCILSLTAQNANWLNYTSGNDITCTVEEGNFIWVGTTGGLVKLNKQTGTAVFYNKANSGLPAIEVTDIAIDSQGNKWIGTGAGLSKFDGTIWSNYEPAEDVYFSVKSIAIDSLDNIWIAAEDLYKFDGINSWTNYSTQYPEVPLDYMTSLAFDHQGRLLVGTWNGLGKFNGTLWTFQTNQQIMPNSYFEIEDIVVDANNYIWLETSINGLIRYNGTGWFNFTSENSDLPHNWTSALFCDNQNNIWVGTEPGYLAKFNGSDWTIYSSDSNPVFTNSVSLITQDSQGNMWIGSDGLYKQAGASWTKYNTSNSGLQSNYISEVYTDSQNTLWANDGYGLNKLAYGTWTKYTTENSELPENNNRRFDSDNNGNLWFISNTSTTYNSKVVKFDGTNWTIFNSLNSVLPLSVHCLTVDNLNNVWASGDNNDVYKYDGVSWAQQSSPPSPNVDNIYNLQSDAQNRIWAFMGYTGIAVFEGNDWTLYTYADAGIQLGTYLCSYVDSQGHAWVGTKEGLIKFDGENWTSYTTSNSAMPYGFVTAICVDNQNNLWLRCCDDSVSGYLVKFDGLNWTSYSTSNSPLTSTGINSLAADNYNNIWIGTEFGGISVYNETGIVANEDDTHTPIAVSQIKAYPNPCSASSDVTFELNSKTKGNIALDIYNLKGQKVKSYSMKGETRVIRWDKTDNYNKKVAPGMYLYKITSGDIRKTGKLIILKM